MGNQCPLLSRPLRLLAPFFRCGPISKASQSYPFHQSGGAFPATAFSFATSSTETTRVLYEPIEDAERMYYRPGGYHPVTLGIRFQDRYRVVHKLGHGTYSTIWLARDELSNKFVAVKVCTADSNPLENNVLLKLSEPQQLSSIIGRSMIPSILDTFQLQGPNDSHVRLVTSPARMSLSDAKNGSWISLFQLEVARSIAAQLVIAVQYIHSQWFVHGDLHRGNVLLQSSRDFDQLSIERLYEKYGEPVLEPVNRLDGQQLPPGVPQHGIIPIWLGEPSEDVTISESRICLSDFGETFSPLQKNKFNSHTPLLIRPPEERFEPAKPLTFPSDIWPLACTIWDIIAQRSLFEGFLTNEDDMTCQQVRLLGPLPIEWSEVSEACQGYPGPHGEQSELWKDRFEKSVQRPRIQENMPPLEPSERDALLSMLRSMLRFRPEDRPSAQQILESEWMVKWALPEFEKTRNSQR